MKQMTPPKRPAQRQERPAQRQGDAPQRRPTSDPIPPPHPATSPTSIFRAASLPAWVLLPLRLFLGITFIYAGVQKLTDPQFFRASAPGYIGRQITGFAHGSPIGGFLLHVAVPHATLFGTLVAYGEIAIGLGALLGLLFRPAAAAGLLLSLIFFLSASWRVYPYFYGADIVFVFGWLTLVLAGPVAGGVPAMDGRLAPVFYARLPRTWRERVTPALAIVLGVPATPSSAPATTEALSTIRRTGRAATARYASHGRTGDMRRREFLRGLAAGGAGMLVLGWIWGALHPAPEPTPSGAGPSSGTGTGAGATPGTTAASGTIAEVSQVPVNSATAFDIPSSGDPGVLVHLTGGQFVAYDAVCTHAGCTVEYDPGSQMLLCPCHGAAFDPAHGAAVMQGPTDQPLASVPIHVDSTSGAITLAS